MSTPVEQITEWAERCGWEITEEPVPDGFPRRVTLTRGRRTLKALVHPSRGVFSAGTANREWDGSNEELLDRLIAAMNRPAL